MSAVAVHRCWLWRCIGLIVLFSGAVLAENDSKQILVIHSYHQGFPFTDNETRGIQSVFDPNDPGTELFITYMDMKRILAADYIEQLVQLYKMRYVDFTFKAILVTDNDALSMMIKHRDDFFPGVPVVFSGINDFHPEMLKGCVNFSGVVQSTDYEATIALALQLRPKANTVVVVSDASRTGMADENGLREIAPYFRGRARFEYLSLASLTLPELLTRLRALGPESVVVLLSHVSDRDGTVYSFKDSIRQITTASAVPVFTVTDYRVGYGPVGGKVVSGYDQGRTAAEMVQRILNGEDIGRIPVNLDSPNRYMFDYDQLQRWEISEQLLPANSIVINKPISFLQRYKILVGMALLIIAGLSVALAILCFNILGRKRAEAALKISEEKYRRIVETAIEGIWAVDANLRTTFVNQHMADMLGFGVDEMIGRAITEFMFDEDVPPYLAYVETRQSDLSEVSEHKYRHKSGTPIWCLVSITPILGESGRFEGAFAMCSDITERKKTEEEQRLAEAKIQYTQKLESLGVLAGGIAHDFNNLLMGILGNAEMAMLELPPNSAARDCIGDVTKAAERAAHLAKQMLDYSGKGRFVVEQVGLTEVMREMAQSLAASISPKAVLEYHLEENLPVVDADVTQIRQIIINLITNASDALGDHEGTIVLSTGRMKYSPELFANAPLAPEEPRSEYAYLEVTDSGCGMQENTLKCIFEPYFSTKFIGRGLGLPAVFGIVRGHRGAILVHSVPGKGTRFRILFPLSAQAYVALEDAPPEAQNPLKKTGKVLVVDDESSVLASTSKMLEHLGFIVVTAKDGMEALDTYQKHAKDIQCVLLDLTMPRMDGEQTLEALRHLCPEIKVILSSGFNEQDVSRRFSGKGLAGFIQKPYRMNELLEKLRKTLA